MAILLIVIFLLNIKIFFQFYSFFFSFIFFIFFYIQFSHLSNFTSALLFFLSHMTQSKYLVHDTISFFERFLWPATIPCLYFFFFYPGGNVSIDHEVEIINLFKNFVNFIKKNQIFVMINSSISTWYRSVYCTSFLCLNKKKSVIKLYILRLQDINKSLCLSTSWTHLFPRNIYFYRFHNKSHQHFFFFFRCEIHFKNKIQEIPHTKPISILPNSWK